MKCAVLLFAALSAAASGAEPGFVSLFDGKTLNGWTLKSKRAGAGYLAVNGVLVCPKDGGGNLLTVKQYANFVFRFEFKMEKGSNNGVGIRMPAEGDAAYQGMEIQILDHNDAQYAGWLKPTQRHGAIYDVIPPSSDPLKPIGEWNSEEIEANGRRIKVTVNGVVVVNADLDSVKDPEILKKHPGLARATGHIGFLGHGTHLEFRNIRIKELK
ncbi:MAG TPA: DUF1080 domain-containing protein [Solibacterales bacterium]|nr:DUF1080 domain-containing protein [Bryobacterales bacterium]